MKINDTYDLYRTENDNKIILYFGSRGFGEHRGVPSCDNIKEIAMNGEYIVGFLPGTSESGYRDDIKEIENKKACRGYFYINMYKENDEKFNLTDIDMEIKFNGKIKYMNSIDFINTFGEGSDDLMNIEGIIFINSVHGIKWTFFIYIFLNIATYIEKLKKNLDRKRIKNSFKKRYSRYSRLYNSRKRRKM
ncbi:hypothetical protein [Pseudoleptotrichia goodfellowii]|nr:hypothetical protein [Pseudoleptotrichia goodfellowii]